MNISMLAFISGTLTKEGTSEEPKEGFMVTCKCPFQLYNLSSECACKAFNGKEKSLRVLCAMTIWKHHESRAPNRDCIVGMIFTSARKTAPNGLLYNIQMFGISHPK